jgi:predicted SnoaL-like aldol condensation-catalyzing enzyme
LSWREVHAFDARDGTIVEHWMDAALLSVYMQMIGQGESDSEPLRSVPSGLKRAYSPQEQLVAIEGYMNMVASHDASTVRKSAGDDYLQHGPFGPNVTRDEFEAGNRDTVWKAIPDISITLELLIADGELVAARGPGRRNAHRLGALWRRRRGQAGRLHRDARLSLARRPGLRALAPG